MISAEQIARINELYKKQKEVGLDEAEKAEQTQLRRLYIEHIKGQVKTHLDNVEIVD